MIAKPSSFWRLNLLAALTSLASFLVIIKLFFLQVTEHKKYAVLADKQHWIYYSIPARRGEILSRDGYPLVSNEIAYLLYGEPPKIEEAEKVARAIIEVLLKDDSLRDTKELEEIKKKEILRSQQALERDDLKWVALFHKISKEQKKEIEKLGLVGLGFEEEPKRLYPEKVLGAHVLGFVGKNQRGEDTGYYGVEGYYDGDLKGQNGKIYEERDALGKPILIGGYERIPAENGRDLVLTIDRAVQFLVEEKLKQKVKEYGAESGTVIIVEPPTGAIIALSNYPTYDPHFPLKEELKIDEKTVEKLERRNLAIASIYEPGSVMKAVTMSAAIDTDTFSPQDTVDDTGPLFVTGHRVDNWDGKHHGTINLIRVLQLSDNVGAATVGRKIGSETLREYFVRFGFGSLTGIDLEGEDTGVVRPAVDWREIDLLTASFGQGISVTPLQILSAFATIANNGLEMRPYIVKEIREGNKVINIKPHPVGQVIKPETAIIITDMLTKAVEGGESKFYNIKNYTIAGKTGTAQIPEEGKYLKNKTNATFIGFLPKDLRFIMLVRLEKPTASVYAAETAVPLWMDITRELVAYYGIPPDK